MQVYTAPDSPNWDRMIETTMRMVGRLAEYVQIRKTEPRPGMITALLNAKVMGEFLPDDGIIGTVTLLIGGGFDTTTSLLAGALEWLDTRADERVRLVDDTDYMNTATEEFLRYFTPAQGGGRTITQDCEVAGFAVLRGRPHVPVVRDVQPRPGVVPRTRRDRARPVPEPARRVRPRRAPLHRVEPRPARLQDACCARRCAACPTTASTARGVEQYESIGTINGYKHLPGDVHARPPRGSTTRRGHGRRGRRSSTPSPRPRTSARKRVRDGRVRS